MEYKKYLNFKYIFTFSSINYLQSAISFLVSVILARHLAKEDFGYFSYGLVFANTIGTIMQFGTERTLVRDLVQQKKPDTIIWSAAWIWLVFGSLLSAGTAIWAFLFSEMNSKAALIVMASSFLGFARGMAPIAWFDFKGKASYQSVILLFDRLLFLTGAAAIIFFYKYEAAIVYIAFIQLIARILALLAEWKFVINTSVQQLKPEPTVIKKILKDNIWVWLAGIGNLLMTQANQVILNGKFGAAELANYGLGIQVITIIRLLQMQLQRLMTPSIAAATAPGMSSRATLTKLYQFCGLTLVLSLGIMVPAYFFTPYIIKTFIGTDYLSAVPVLNVLYAWSVLYGVAIIINQFLIGLHQQKFFFVSTAVFGIMSLVLAEICIDTYQAMGAAISLLIAHSCSVVFQFVIVLRKIKQHDRSTV